MSSCFCILRRHLRLAVLIFCAAGVFAGAGTIVPQQRPKPLAKQEITNSLKGDVPPARVEDLARENGVGFEMTPQAERECASRRPNNFKRC